MLKKALCRAVGIRAKIISGVAIHVESGDTWEDTHTTQHNHTWNEAFVDGRWVVMDTTWDTYMWIILPMNYLTPGILIPAKKILQWIILSYSKVMCKAENLNLKLLKYL